MSAGAGKGARREALPARSAVTWSAVTRLAAAPLADPRDPANERRGLSPAKSRSAHRRALIALGALTAGAAAAIACSSSAAGFATSAYSASSAGTTQAHAAVRPGPVVTAVTVALVVPATASPVSSPSPSASSAAPSPTPAPSATPTATSSPAPSATPTATPTATSSPAPSATPTDTPSATPTATPSASPSPAKHTGPPRSTSSRPASTAIPLLPSTLAFQTQGPLPIQAVLSPTRARPSSRPPIASPSATAAAASTSQLADPPSRDVATTLNGPTDTGPPLAVVAAALAALGALAGCSFALVRHQRAYPRRVPKHSHRATRRRPN
jgi:hypothetical protein